MNGTDSQVKPVALYSTRQAFLLAGMTTYQAGHQFLFRNPHLRPERKRRQLAWTMAEILRLQDAYWKRNSTSSAKNIIADVMRRAQGA